MEYKLKIFTTLLLIIFFSIISCDSPEKNIDTPKVKDNIIVGVYNGSGASPICVLETMEALKIDNGINQIEISPTDIMTGKLDELDALIFPGGSGSKEYNSLGLLAAEKVKAFGKQKDKGIVGICAGGYLLSTTPTYPNLEVLGVPHRRKFYNRGRGLIGFSLNEKGKEIFYELKDNDSLYVQYYDGPIFENAEKNGLNVLGVINSDIATHKGYPHDYTQGKPAFFTKKYGQGKVFVSVGHPEATAGMRWIVPRMARWVSNNELITYDKDLIRPEINNHDILFYKEQTKQESKLFWDLLNDNIDVISNAMDSLYMLRSRPSIRWSIGLLRHKNPNIKIKAAKYLLETEYTAAIPDLQVAVNNEKGEELKGKLQEVLEKLEGFID